ncbi:hypothetical protein RRG08_056423 [Elysia crispata]|uniref:C-type lectin domain-containing protein n=1 Tax=Elysia crispata TaxID=231223 RepID=A0AAE0ZWS4_9GAST|nr:hypothetical protein RRG08_056423 [Elysia crispata]
MAAYIITAFMVVLCGHAILYVEATIQAYGCDQDWTNYEDHCYTVIVGEWDNNSAKNVCSDLGANATSIWSPVEMAFIASLWQSHQIDNPYMWTGLRGSGGGSWVWEDKSSFSVLQPETGEYWSVLDKLYPVQGSSTGQSLALTRQGNPVLMSSHDTAGGVVCKKPLPRVFALTTVLNQTSPSLGDRLDIVQSFQRVLPPVLSQVPSRVDSPLVELEVTTDTSCAFQCHRTSPCRVIELSCITQYHCGTYRCSLFDGLPV